MKQLIIRTVVQKQDRRVKMVSFTLKFQCPDNTYKRAPSHPPPVPPTLLNTLFTPGVTRSRTHQWPSPHPCAYKPLEWGDNWLPATCLHPLCLYSIVTLLCKSRYNVMLRPSTALWMASVNSEVKFEKTLNIWKCKPIYHLHRYYRKIDKIFYNLCYSYTLSS